jgi:uncharacterized membrane protein YkoI
MKTVGTTTALLAVLVGSVLALSGPAWSDKTISKKENDETKKAVALSATAKVTIDQAIKTASEKVAGKVIEAELEEKIGNAVWEVEIVGTDGKVIEVHVDAMTGAIVATEEKHSGKKWRSRVQHGYRSSPSLIALVTGC